MPFTMRARPTCPPPPAGDGSGDDEDALTLASQPSTDEVAAEAVEELDEDRAEPSFTQVLTQVADDLNDNEALAAAQAAEQAILQQQQEQQQQQQRAMQQQQQQQQ